MIRVTLLAPAALGLFAFALLALPGALACSSSTQSAPGEATPDGGTSPGGPDGSTPDGAPRPAADFLSPDTYADLLVIDASFPFGVTATHATTRDVAGARWGRHEGPMLTTEVYKAAGENVPGVVRWTLPAAATAAATDAETPFTKATDLPAQLFYGADGMVDLPFGPFDLLSYTGGGAPFAGEALLYTADLTSLPSRAKVNGFYSGIGLATPTGGRIVYSALAAFDSVASTTNANGLYASDVCNGSLVPNGDCTKGVRLVTWQGASGPVVSDAHDNVFVAASLTGGASSDAIYGLSKAQALGDASQTATTLVESDTAGTASVAAVAPDAASPGWVLAKGFDAKSAAFAQGYADADGALTRSGARVASALRAGAKAEGFSVFTDSQGDLWVAVSVKSGGVFLELRRK